MSRHTVHARDRFWSKVAQTGNICECWIWTSSINVLRGGYGIFNAGGGRYVYSHRMAYELLRGPIPDGLVIDHLCCIPACANPWHMEPVSRRENAIRGFAMYTRKTRCPKGHPYAGENLSSTAVAIRTALSAAGHKARRTPGVEGRPRLRHE